MLFKLQVLSLSVEGNDSVPSRVVLVTKVHGHVGQEPAVVLLHHDLLVGGVHGVKLLQNLLADRC